MPVLITPPDMPEDVVAAVELVGNRARVELLRILAVEGCSMTNLELAKRLGTNKISVRRHLLEMEEQGLVQADLSLEERGGKTVHWTINRPRFRDIMTTLRDYVLNEPAP